MRALGGVVDARVDYAARTVTVTVDRDWITAAATAQRLNVEGGRFTYRMP